jgi:ATP-dependent Clp protease ATP-binding subunit ClpC
MKSGLVMGQLIGTGQEAVAANVKLLKTNLTTYIDRKRKTEYFPEPVLSSVKLKTYSVEVRPSFREGNRLFPVKESVKLEIPAVYGPNEEGTSLCFLPLLDHQFYFYQEKELARLVKHYAQDVLRQMEPNEIYRLALPSSPFLEKLLITPSRSRRRESAADAYQRRFVRLQAVAERLPFKRKEQSGLLPRTAWGRASYVMQLVGSFEKQRGNLILMGKPGVGKSAIIEEAIRRTSAAQKGKPLFEQHTFWRTNPARLIARAKYLGEWQEIIESLIEELSYARGYLWIENLVALARLGGDGPEDSVAAFMLPFISEGNLKLIGELNPRELDVLRQLMPGLVEHFEIVEVSEMDGPLSLQVMERYHEFGLRQVKKGFTGEALELTYVLLDRFLRYQSFPGKAIQFMGQCLKTALQQAQKEIGKSEVIANFTQQTGIPDFLLRDEVTIQDSQIEDFFKNRIKGQDHVIDRIASVIKVFKAGLNDPEKPVATWLFAGPTGVGKTALARAISDYFYGKGQKTSPLIRLDMSEFQHPAQIYRLIGADGKLVQSVREKPFSVVLFDEVEKAHPAIFDALMTVLDEGILIDAMGRLTDFRNTLIIMTSNLGSQRGNSLGFRDYQGDTYESDIRAFFRPEFYNRIDASLVFKPLDEASIRAITLLELKGLRERDGIRQRKIQLRFTDRLIAFIAEIGFDPKFGARPLQRELEKWVVAPFARWILDEQPGEGQQILLDYDGKEVVCRLEKQDLG